MVIKGDSRVSKDNIRNSLESLESQNSLKVVSKVTLKTIMAQSKAKAISVYN